MNGFFNLLDIRRKLGRDRFLAPREQFIKGQWVFGGYGLSKGTSVIVSCALHYTPGAGETDWIHASISHNDRMPSYEDLVLLHKAVFGDKWAFQVFAPVAHHVNIHANALHLWGRADGVNQLPNFGEFGSI